MEPERRRALRRIRRERLALLWYPSPKRLLGLARRALASGPTVDPVPERPADATSAGDAPVAAFVAGTRWLETTRCSRTSEEVIPVRKKIAACLIAVAATLALPATTASAQMCVPAPVPTPAPICV
jgi:hypothetical protein